MRLADNSPLVYTPLFCEENIWKLLQQIEQKSPSLEKTSPLDVLFIINPYQSVALYNQQRSPIGQAVIWDYHVILSAWLDHRAVVFDFDSRCPFPCPIEAYFTATFVQSLNLPENVRPQLHPIRAGDYYRHFYSDRSHMQGVIPSSQFPNYPIIEADSSPSRLTLSQCRQLDASPTCIFTRDLITPDEYLQQRFPA